MVSLNRKREGILCKRIPAVFIIPIVILFIVAAFFLNRKSENLKQSALENHSTVVTPKSKDVSVYRMNGYQLTKPLLLSNPAEESANLRNIKLELAGFIQQKKSSGEINNTSVNIKLLMNGEWTDVNPDEVYVAGSMRKIPTMLAFLKDSENNPGLLDKKIYYDKVPDTKNMQKFNSGSITPGRSYKVRELLDYMITKSDYNATMLLDKNLSFDKVNRLFTDLDLPTVDYNKQYYHVTAPQYSRFLQVLFNATYLSAEHAAFAMELLTRTSFSTGLAAGLPKDVKIAHKFAVAGSEVRGESQLHETGIVFMDGHPYLITVMTKGMNFEKLPGIISEISRRVYSKMLTLYKPL